ncbi:MAG: DUF6069 family protein [Pseudonocardiaceae bacterium]
MSVTDDHVPAAQHRSDGVPPRSGQLSPPRGLSWWQAIAAAAVGATVVNLLILLVGRAAGASFELVDGAALHAVTFGGVITSSAVPLVIGTVLATLLSVWWPGFLRLAQIVGGGLALVSVAGPLLADTDTATRLALAAMHVVVGVAVVLSLEAIRRRTSTGTRSTTR